MYTENKLDSKNEFVDQADFHLTWTKRKICHEMSVTCFFRDNGVLLSLRWNQCVCVLKATVITTGGKRSSVTSKPDSLITKAAKDLLVYQSEPRALHFPSGDETHYHEPVGPRNPDTLFPWSGHARATLNLLLMSIHACTQFDTRTYKQHSQIFRIYTYVLVHSIRDTNKHREIEAYIRKLVLGHAD